MLIAAYIFSVFEATMSCVTRLTFACDKQTHMHVQQSVMSTVCLTYDLVKHCPSVTMETPSLDIPKCMGMEDDKMDQSMEDDKMDDMKDKLDDKMDMKEDSTCSLEMVNNCVGMMFLELYGPFLDCARFHRYVYIVIRLQRIKTSSIQK